jgi:hypothetical protein
LPSHECIFYLLFDWLIHMINFGIDRK